MDDQLIVDHVIKDQKCMEKRNTLIDDQF